MSDDSRFGDDARLELGEDLAALIEVLARHVHDTWMRRRLRDGWTHGPFRDDTRREHPCLVPYERLPEAERAYDREVTLATLQAVIALGYEIVKPGSGRGGPG